MRCCRGVLFVELQVQLFPIYANDNGDLLTTHSIGLRVSTCLLWQLVLFSEGEKVALLIGNGELSKHARARDVTDRPVTEGRFGLQWDQRSRLPARYTLVFWAVTPGTAS